VFVEALIEGVFQAACGEASGLVTSIPGFPTFLVFNQVADTSVAPPRSGFPAVFALNLYACSVDVAFSIVAAFERLVAGRAGVSAALLLDRLSSSTLRFGQDAACCGRTGGRRECGGGRVGGNVIDIAIRKRRIIVGLRGA